MIKQLIGFISVIFGVLLLTFMLIHLVPGDPVEVMLGELASAADRDALRVDWGLNQPLFSQFGSYLNKLAHGDFGQSIHAKTPSGTPILKPISKDKKANFKVAG